MAEARSRANWNHTTSIWALFHDIHRDPKTKPQFKLADFNPHLNQERAEKVPKIKMRDLKGMVPALAELAKQSQRAPTLTERIHGG
jgi:hypothetical protein